MATKEEQRWMRCIKEIGCIVCYLLGHPETPGVVHHLLKNGLRIGHKATICLCEPGHHQYPPKGSGKIARHPTRARFVSAYGAEETLLERTKDLVLQRFGWRPR